MKKDFYITIFLLIIMSLLLFNQLCNKNKIIEGKILKINNDSYDISLEIILSNGRKNIFYIDQKTIIYDGDNNQTAFSHLKYDESVSIEYKPYFFQKSKASVIKIINDLS